MAATERKIPGTFAPVPGGYSQQIGANTALFIRRTNLLLISTIDQPPCRGRCRNSCRRCAFALCNRSTSQLLPLSQGGYFPCWGYTPAPLYYFLLAGIPHSAPQARGNTGRLSFRPAVGQAVPAALVSPLTPFPGISAVVLNLLLVYQPQTAQGGIFLARRSAARLKNQAAGRGTIPLRARPARLILFLIYPS